MNSKKKLYLMYQYIAHGTKYYWDTPSHLLHFLNQVYVNKPVGEAHFIAYLFGDGNAIARHGIHGFQWNYEVPVDGKLLINGENTIYLKQSKGDYMFSGIMYDYLRFEGPLGVKPTRRLLRSSNWNQTM
jgi:Polysaccharide lyase family 4, domain III